MALRRRTVIRALGPLLSVGAAGCMSADEATDEGGTVDIESPVRDADTGDATRTAGPWIMDKDDLLVSVTVEEGFLGDVVLEADCRAEDVSMSPGENVGISRRENGEECSIHLISNGDELYSGFIRLDQSFELTVQDNGDVNEAISVK